MHDSGVPPASDGKRHDIADSQALRALLARLQALHPKKIDLSLGRMQRLLAALDHPERRLPPVIHVAGTNGKGSVVAIARAIAEAAGLRVHVYTSPHLISFRERIRLAGSLIDEAVFIDVLERAERASAENPITFFEITTAAAFLAMAETPADLAIIEVGLGGRLDATNVVSDVAASVITPVSHDHQEFLGERLEQIAAEKAGIIRPGSPVIVGPQVREVSGLMKRVAREHDAPAYIAGRDWQVRAEDEGQFRFSDAAGSLTLPRPRLEGIHQIFNAGIAVAALRTQAAVAIPPAAYRAAMGWIRWPARLQSLASTPLNALLPEGSQLWLDGGHNPAAGQAIRGFLQRFDAVSEPVVMVVGMMKNKDASGFLEPIATQSARLIAVPIPGEAGAAKPADIAAAASDAGMRATVARSLTAALKQISSESRADAPPVVMIAGSLYLAGEALRRAGIAVT